MKPDRRIIGRLAEDLAVDFLVRNGVRIVARNVKVKTGEVDVVAKIDHTRVVVEVRSVTTHDHHGSLPSAHPLDAFDDSKARQVRRLASLLGCSRVDLVAVRFHRAGADLHWVKNIG
jgi:putative endonuclease